MNNIFNILINFCQKINYNFLFIILIVKEQIKNKLFKKENWEHHENGKKKFDPIIMQFLIIFLVKESLNLI